MATAADPTEEVRAGWSTHLAENLQEQKDEVLALQSIYEGEENRLVVFSEGPEKITESEDSEENAKLYKLQLQVPVKLEVAMVTMDVCMPIREPADKTEQDLEVPKPGAVNFTRSDSGHNLIASIRISHLTPLNLSVILPAVYPACGPPQFTLSSLWLSWQQLGALCGMLDNLWQESPGMPILYTWIDWLDNNSLNFLGLHDHIILREISADDVVSDERALPECQDIEEAVTTMMRYNVAEEGYQFRRTDHECCVCYMELPGTEFFRMKQCTHHVCRECMQSLCQIHVKEGSVKDLVCPASECKTDIPPSIIRELVGQEQFDRYERLALQKALDSMGDIVWCPRCGGAVVRESDKTLNLAYCIPCQFSFCFKCYSQWHQGQPCLLKEDELKDLEKKLQSERWKVIDVKREMEKLREEISSKTYVDTRAMTCPSCDANIQKISGCNKVLCHCGRSMCYICGADITSMGYQHFVDSSKCTTFTDDGLEDAPLIRRFTRGQPVDPAKAQKIMDMRTRLAENPLLQQVRCPNCKRNNLRGMHGNNHVKCWNCNCGFCFLCQQNLDKVKMTLHFKPPRPCQQHTAEAVLDVPHQPDDT